MRGQSVGSRFFNPKGIVKSLGIDLKKININKRFTDKYRIKIDKILWTQHGAKKKE